MTIYNKICQTLVRFTASLWNEVTDNKVKPARRTQNFALEDSCSGHDAVCSEFQFLKKHRSSAAVGFSSASLLVEFT